MSRLHHQHYVVPLPGEPELFALNSPLHREEVPAIKQFSEDLARDMERAILDEILPPAQAIDTSLAAAARIRPHTARVREAIYLYIRACGGATAGEIATQCGLNPSTVRPRLLELQGRAKWAPGLPARIQRSPEVRKHMRIYRAL